MRPSKRALLRVSNRAEGVLDRARALWWDRFGFPRPLLIEPYRGFGTRRRVELRGRVLGDRQIGRHEHDRGPLANLRDMIKRYRSQEIPGAVVEVRLDGLRKRVITDKEGYFRVELEPDEPLEAGGLWRAVELELLEPLQQGQGRVVAAGLVQVPPQDARLGVISDVDDTIVRTGATNLLQHARIVLFNSARSRTPLRGVGAFYQALHEGPKGLPRNPMFYVSSSPWNLYELFEDFLEIHGIPKGSWFLKAWGLSEEHFFKSSHTLHKGQAIRRVLNTFPELPFLLIGDSGQKDPEIYARIVRDHPGRIAAVYIRDVGRPQARDRVWQLAEETAAAGVEMLLCKDTLVAARHAHEHGWITAENVEDVRRAVAAEEEKPRNLEDVAEEMIEELS